MRAFAELLDRLVLTPQRNAKIKLMADYFRDAPDPDRGYALAAIAGTLALETSSRACSGSWCWSAWTRCCSAIPTTMSAISPRRYRWSGKGHPAAKRLCRTFRSAASCTSWKWPDAPTCMASSATCLISSKDQAASPSSSSSPVACASAFRHGSSSRRWPTWAKVDITEIETLWHGLSPPYVALFRWLDGKAEKPVLDMPAVFHAVMLATPVGDNDLAALDPKDFAAEWKWDGIRVQLASLAGMRRLYSRSGDDISGAFPDILEAADFEGIIDGELLVGGTHAHQSRHPDLLRPAATAEPKDRDPQDAGGISGLHPRLRPAV